MTKRIYYGWLVLGAVSGINFANAATSIGVLTVFVIPMGDELGWSRTQIAGATTVGAVLGAALAPITGRLSDRFGSRALLSIGAALIVLSTLSLAFVQMLVGFYIGYGIARLSDQGFVQAVSPPVVAKWFLRRRGRALAVLFLMASLGGVLLPLAVQAVTTLADWHVAWAMLSGIMLVFGFLPCVVLLRRQPEDMGLAIDGDALDQQTTPSQLASQTPRDQGSDGGEIQWKWGEAIRTPTLWILLLSMFVVGIATAGVGLHLVPYLVEQGVGSTAAVGAVSITFLASAAGTIWWGVLAERYPVRVLLTIVNVLGAVAFVVLLTADSLMDAYVFALLRGFTEGGLRTLTTLLLADYYGRESLGSLYGLTRSVQVAGFALGPLTAGAVYDSTQSYTGAFSAFLVLAIIGAILIAGARRPIKPTSIEAAI